METHYTYDDTQFEQEFATAQLPADLFNHEAHLRLAWIHLKKYGLDQSLLNIQEQLRNYTKKLGAPEKYHTTVTIAAVKAVHHHMLKSGTTNFREFIAENPRLKDNFMELMKAHYSFNIFDSEHCRSTFMEPDLLPF